MKIIRGNIFATNFQTIVNTVNCVGVMGAGIAYECRLRYPKMYEQYIELCRKKQMNIGTLWLYKGKNRWILNFPTKFDWKYPSKPEYLHKGLQKFVDTYKEKGITSIAFPILGASHGGIPKEISIGIMKQYLEKCQIPIEIYEYEPLAYDDLFEKFKELWNAIPERELSIQSGLRIDFVRKIREALRNENIRSINLLLSVNGIGEVTLEKAFHFATNYKPLQQILDL